MNQEKIFATLFLCFVASNEIATEKKFSVPFRNRFHLSPKNLEHCAIFATSERRLNRKLRRCPRSLRRKKFQVLDSCSFVKLLCGFVSTFFSEKSEKENIFRIKPVRKMSKFQFFAIAEMFFFATKKDTRREGKS
jgi:hypothetical protein